MTTTLRRSNSGSDLANSLSSFLGTPDSKKTKSGSATVAGDMTDSTEIYIRPDGKKVRRVRKVVRKKSEGDLGDLGASLSMLDSSADFSNEDSGHRRSSGAATVAGDVNTSEEEIYIRPDGKKVRRIKRTVSKQDLSASASPLDAETTNKTLGGFLGANTKASTGISGSATVAGDKVTKEDSEIIIRPDGKKVRRIKKTVIRSKSARNLGDDATGGSNGADSGGLESFLDHNTSGSSMSGAATVAGDSSDRKIPERAKSIAEGEIYINADGRKVRRVKKSSLSLSSSPSTLGGFLEDSSFSATPKSRSSATVAGDTPSRSKVFATEGEIFVRPDGKKVRRVRKVADDSSDPSASLNQSLSGFLDFGKSEQSSNKMSGSATVTGGSNMEGEMYIRADGKKVRRVRKSVAATEDVTTAAITAAAASNQSDAKPEPPKHTLSGFLNFNKPAEGKMSGSATVAGDRVTKDEGEIIIRADGKKVRRVRKVVRTKSAGSSGDLAAASASLRDDNDLATSTPKPLSSASRETSSVTPSPSRETEAKKSLENFLDSKPVSRPKGGSATVTGTPTTSKNVEGEIYINSEGKRVRRIRKSQLAARSAETGASAILGNFLDSKPAAKKTDSATVAGDTPTKTKAYSEGEIYIRADGKKVRRVKKSTLNNDGADRTSLSGLLDDPSKASANHKSGSATVAGDQVVKRVPDGEIIIRADGKKVLRRKKQPTASTDSQEGEVYRRADGKLVRRVKRSAAGDLAGFLDKNEDKADIKEKTAGSATVAGDMVKAKAKAAAALAEPFPAKANVKAAASLTAASAFNEPISAKAKAAAALAEPVKPKPKLDEPTTLAALTEPVMSMPKLELIPNDRSTTPQTVPMSESSGHIKDGSASESTSKDVAEFAEAKPVSSSVQLSEDEEALAGFYRKKLKVGMPDDTVRNKMEQDGVDARIIAAVVGGESAVLTSYAKVAAQTAETSQLSAEEEEVATRFRRMSKMGLPEDAVRHKMVQEGIDERVIHAVFAPAHAFASVAPAATTSAGTLVSLTDDEEALAGFYRKKLKMGMPQDAVRHKMVQDGVEERVINAVLSATEGAPAAQPPSISISGPVLVQLTDDEEALAGFYRKKLKLGMPEDGVRHKMVQDGVDERIINAVLSGSASARISPTTQAVQAPAPESAPAPVPSSSTSGITTEEQFLVDSYKKMLKMGMPKDAVRHKMAQDEVDERLIQYVMTEEPVQIAAPPLAPAPAQPPKASNSVAYIVVVNEETDSSAVPPLSDSTDEKFAVKVETNDGDAGTAGGQANTETKFMSLDDIARLSGQSKKDLEAMVSEKRNAGEAPPRFVLQSMYEVALPTGSSHGISAAPAVSVPPGAQMAPIRDGQEVVDSELAVAARAVSALGDGDMLALLSKLQGGEIGELLAKLQEAEKRQKKLEKQLAQAGVAIAEDIDYGEALAKIGQIAKRMNEIGGSDVTVEDNKELQNKLREEYFKLEQQMERYNSALMLTDEYQAEQLRAEKKWEDDNAPGNLEALKKLRRHMPVKIRHMSEADLTNNPTPNGKFIPQPIAKKFKRTNVLQLLRINPDDIERMHPSTLENMRVTGLTLTERRALYCHLKPLGPKWERNKAEKMTERKWTWYQMMKNNFKENLAPYTRHCDQYGPPEKHVGCPLLGKLCPIKADLILDYNGDYGYTDKDEFEVSEVRKADTDDPGAKAMLEALELVREKKANERADLLKKHYKGKLLQVSKANGSCEAMDECMDKMENHTMKWIEFMIEKGENESEDDKKKEITNFTEALNELKLSVLDFAQRAGIQVSGKKKAGTGADDPRSSVEAGLSEEVYECTTELFSLIKTRSKEINIKDTRVEKTIELLEGMLSELHGRNISTLAKLGVPRPDRSRKWKKNNDLRKDVEEKLKPKEQEIQKEEAPGAGTRPPAAGGRGGLMSAISGRGRGGGRGDLLGAIAGRGRGGRGGRGGADGGRGGLLASIQGRGSTEGDAGGRGGLMAAIQGRGGGGADASRGGLLAAIQARGGGD